MTHVVSEGMCGVVNRQAFYIIIRYDMHAYIDERVWVKVIALREGKVSLSLKDVEQGTGRDLNPEHEYNSGAGGKGGGADDRDRYPEVNSLHKGIVKVSRLSCFLPSFFQLNVT